jgi:hypothetical protein
MKGINNKEEMIKIILLKFPMVKPRYIDKKIIGFYFPANFSQLLKINT